MCSASLHIQLPLAPTHGGTQVEANIVRCPDPEGAERMIKRIDEIRKTGDSIGGVVECVARNVPAGLGSPVFDKLEAELAKACMSLPASKGFEVCACACGTALFERKSENQRRKLSTLKRREAVEVD